MTGFPHHTIGEDDDRYVPVQHTEAGKTLWALLDTDTGTLVAGYDETVEMWAIKDSASHFAKLLRELDSLRPSRRTTAREAAHG